MTNVARAVFGARGQLVAGAALLALTGFQWTYWTFIAPPSVVVLFHVSMEALAFAAYATVATALGYRATERVEEHVVNNLTEGN